MANFPRQKPAGYATREAFPSAHATAIDANLVKAPNFSDGSAHAPSGFVDVSDANGGNLRFTNGAWPALNSRTIDKLIMPRVIRWEGVGTQPDFLGGADGYGFSGDIYPAFRTKVSPALQKWWLLLDGLLPGAPIVDVRLWTRGASLVGALTVPAYRLLKSAMFSATLGTSPVYRSSATNDTHTSGNWTNTELEQIITPTGGQDTPANGEVWALEVDGPTATTSTSMFIIGPIKVRQTVTSLRPQL